MGCIYLNNLNPFIMNALTKFIKSHTNGQLYVIAYNLNPTDFFSFKLLFGKR